MSAFRAYDAWNRCDSCGKFIAYGEFAEGRAKRILIYPDSQFTDETWETLCQKCWNK